MNELITLSGVSGYMDENGTAHLRLEDVARGLGFTETAASGNITIRWRTIRNYLSDFGIAGSCDGETFIPENIFYRLAMKAKNETAEKFQAVVADEILPTIRKTGQYKVKPMTQAEMLVVMAQHNVEMERKVLALEEKADKNDARLDAALEALAALSPESWKEEMNRIINGMCQEHGLNYQTFRGAMYDELESVARCNIETRRRRLRERMQQAGATYKERNEISKLDIIDRDPQLRAIFEGIVRRQQAKYTK